MAVLEPTPARSAYQRLADLLEHPLFTLPVGTLSGLIGMFYFWPVLVVCGVCILLALHRSKALAGVSPRKQVAAYIFLFVVTTAGLYGAGKLIERGTRQSASDVANAVIAKLKPVSAPIPAVSEPTFTVSSKSFGVEVARNLFTIDPRLPRTGLVRIGDVEVLQAYIEGDKLFVDATVYSYEGGPVVTLKHNHLEDVPVGWDTNYDGSALEIVDGNLLPHFQLIYNDSSFATVYGIFHTPHNRATVLLDTNGLTWLDPFSEEKVHMNRLFKYPSRLYMGQEISSSP
jgi:hypothetical protein